MYFYKSDKNRNLGHFKYLTVVLVVFVTIVTIMSLTPNDARASTTSSTSTGFHSALETYVTYEPQGYGVYEVRESNVFSPGETLLLYVEPAGMTYNPVTEGKSNCTTLR